ncbi:hypothetical protein TNCV_1478231, partial [Trichonephila clavipes]
MWNIPSVETVKILASLLRSTNAKILWNVALRDWDYPVRDLIQRTIIRTQPYGVAVSVNFLAFKVFSSLLKGLGAYPRWWIGNTSIDIPMGGR